MGSNRRQACFTQMSIHTSVGNILVDAYRRVHGHYSELGAKADLST